MIGRRVAMRGRIGSGDQGMHHRGSRGAAATPHQRGVTLIELLIALVIVGILSAVALPLYTQYQERTYRSGAFAHLGDCAQAMERYYTRNFTYGGAADGGADTGAPTAAICADTTPDSGTARYDITIEAADATTFTLRATPIAGTANEDDGIIEIDASGVRRWDRENDGLDADDNTWEE
jgi:type IV pilus assembly protein PilE